MRPTASQLEQLRRLEVDFERAQKAGRDEMVWQVRRRPHPDTKRIRIAPGLMGRLVEWGDGTWAFPSVAFVKTADVGTFLARCREQVAAASARVPSGEEQGP